jgi:hypothetical protein
MTVPVVILGLAAWLEEPLSLILEASNAMLEEPSENGDEVLRGPEVELKVPKP